MSRAERVETSFPEHHRCLEELLQDLRAEVAAYEDDWRAICCVWAQFERELEEHMGNEERWLLPYFAVEHPEEARVIAGEHAAIRRHVYELAIAVELHAARIEAIDELIAELRAHARRESAELYPWAARNLTDEARRTGDRRQATGDRQ